MCKGSARMRRCGWRPSGWAAAKRLDVGGGQAVRLPTGYDVQQPSCRWPMLCWCGRVHVCVRMA